ncbi:MAG: AAA family ATPase [Nitrospiraceae bacterium]|nr:AAA family ATPase [Nitrospiraceae bacterium]
MACVFNVKKRSWKAGIQVAVEIGTSQLGALRRIMKLNDRLAARLMAVDSNEISHYQERAGDVFAQVLCRCKLGLRLQSGLAQDNQRIVADELTDELNAEAFNTLMLARAIHNYQEKQSLSNSIIFDRAIPDMIAYANLFQSDTTAYVNASKEFRYNPMVFYFAAWQEIYTNDEERKIGFEGAQAFGIDVKSIYESLGYRILEVPRLSIVERAKFILERI